jgi:hypothetical protein
MFITPVPDPSSAISLLKRLSQRQASQELGTRFPAGEFIRHNSSQNQRGKASKRDEVIGLGTQPIDLRVLDTDPFSITLCWAPLGEVSFSPLADRDQWAFHVDMGVVEILIRVSTEQCVAGWHLVYRGQGRGCKVGRLQPSTCYHIQLRIPKAFRSVIMKSDYNYNTTYISVSTDSLC